MNADKMFFGGLIVIELLVLITIIILEKRNGGLTFSKILFYLYILVSGFIYAYCKRFYDMYSLFVVIQLGIVIGLVYGKYDSIGYIISFCALCGIISYLILPGIVDIFLIGILGIIIAFSPEIARYLNMRKMNRIGAIEVPAVCIRYNTFIHFDGPNLNTPVYEFYIDENKYTAKPNFGTYLSKKYLPEVGSIETILVDPKNPKRIYIPYPRQNLELKIVSLIPSVIFIIIGLVMFLSQIIKNKI